MYHPLSKSYSVILLCNIVLLPGMGWSRSRVLAVPNFKPARIIPPRHPGPRPIVIGLHGNFDRSEWFCEAMDELVEGRAWLLCPRGIPRTDVPKDYDRWTFPARNRVMAEIQAGLAALKKSHASRIAHGPLLLAGFSLGAILSSRFAVADPQQFPRLYLVEGAHHVWTPANIKRFAKGGGRQVLFACGRAGCGKQSRRICTALEKAGVTCGEVTSKGLGHSYVSPLTNLARPLFRALVAGDTRWTTAFSPGAPSVTGK